MSYTTDMDRREKIKFIKDLMKAIRKNILCRVDDMPEHWNGHQLRLYIADKAAEQICVRPDKRAMRDYKNEVLVHNL